MISYGAALFFVAFPAFALGMIMGAVSPRGVLGDVSGGDDDQLASINAAATEAYRRVSADIAEHRSMTLAEASEAIARARGRHRDGEIEAPRILLTGDAVPVGGMEIGSDRFLDGDGFRALAGVDPQTVLNALGHRPMIRWGDPIPEWFTLA